jgi:hypothetical protein
LLFFLQKSKEKERSHASGLSAGRNQCAGMLRILFAGEMEMFMMSATTAIDAKLAAGRLTAAQATQIRSNITTRVTEEVNEVRGSGKMGRGHGDKGGAGGLVGPGPTAGAAKFAAKTTIKAVKA